MAYKKFCDLKVGDKLFFIEDRHCTLWQNNSYGFANKNYGVNIFSETIDRCRQRYPRKDDSPLLDITFKQAFETQTNSWYKEIQPMYGITILKEEGNDSCLFHKYRNVHVFTTKEELIEKVKKVTDVVEKNLGNIKEDLTKL